MNETAKIYTRLESSKENRSTSVYLRGGRMHQASRDGFTEEGVSVCPLLGAEPEVRIWVHTALFGSTSQEALERQGRGKATVRVSYQGSPVGSGAWFHQDFLRNKHNAFQNCPRERQETGTLIHWLLSPLVESFLQGLCVLMGVSIGKFVGQRTKRCLLGCLRWSHMYWGRSGLTWKSPGQTQLPLVLSWGIESQRHLLQNVMETRTL